MKTQYGCCSFTNSILHGDFYVQLQCIYINGFGYCAYIIKVCISQTKYEVSASKRN